MSLLLSSEKCKLNLLWVTTSLQNGYFPQIWDSGEDIEWKEPLLIVGRIENKYSDVAIVWKFVKKHKNRTTIWPSYFTAGHIPREFCTLS